MEEEKQNNKIIDNNQENLNENKSLNILDNKNNNNKPDLNEDITIQKKRRHSQDNLAYYERFINYEKQKEERITEMKKELDEKEKKTLKDKPYISRKSVQLVGRINIKENILERMKEEEKKTKEKKDKLIEKINNERAKKKEEIEKPLEFNIKSSKIDKKFDKVYQEMLKKDQLTKEKMNIFNEAIKQYEMKECVFQPNINRKDEDTSDENKKTKKRISSCEVTQRLYNDDLNNKKNKRKSLEKKYELSFKPKISDKSKDLAMKRKKKNDKENMEINTINKKSLNNSVDKNCKNNNKRVSNKKKI